MKSSQWIYRELTVARLEMKQKSRLINVCIAAWYIIYMKLRFRFDHLVTIMSTDNDILLNKALYKYWLTSDAISFPCVVNACYTEQWEGKAHLRRDFLTQVFVYSAIFLANTQPERSPFQQVCCRLDDDSGCVRIACSGLAITSLLQAGNLWLQLLFIDKLALLISRS